MKKQEKTDLLSALLAIVFGGFVYFMSGSIVVKAKGGDIGSQFLPRLIAGLMILLGVLLLIGTLRKIKASAGTQTQEESKEDKSFIPALLSFVNLIVYVLIFKPVGFLVSTVIYLTVQMIIMSPDHKPGVKKLGFWVALAVIVAVAIYFIFTKGFSLPLPSGILG